MKAAAKAFETKAVDVEIVAGSPSLHDRARLAREKLRLVSLAIRDAMSEDGTSQEFDDAEDVLSAIESVIREVTDDLFWMTRIKGAESIDCPNDHQYFDAGGFR